MIEWLMVANAAAVGIYGIVLSAAFSQIIWTRKRNWFFCCMVIFLGMLQGILYSAFGTEGLRLWYPVVTHLPLVIFLGLMSKRWLWSLIAVLTAYLCCQLRRWIALFCVAVFAGGEVMQNIVELAVTIPLLALLIRFAAPSVRGMGRYSPAIQIQFGLLPAIGYGFDYVARVYTDWLTRGIPAAVEFMPFVCVLAYLVFSMHFSQTTRRQSELEQIQTVLNLQVRRFREQIGELRRSQELTAAYRHDLRHHLQYLSACMETGNLEQAQTYIRELDQAVTSQVVTRYCENTAVNLILSAYGERAERAGILLSAHVRLGETLAIPDMDLCVLLSNALENALHACEEASSGPLEVHGFSKGGRVFLEIINPCAGAVHFKDGRPVTEEEGHGFGVRSICAVVEKYGGLYNFEYADGKFILRLSL